MPSYSFKISEEKEIPQIMLGQLTIHLEEEKWVQPHFFIRINCKWIKFKHLKLEVLEDMDIEKLGLLDD